MANFQATSLKDKTEGPNTITHNTLHLNGSTLEMRRKPHGSLKF